MVALKTNAKFVDGVQNIKKESVDKYMNFVMNSWVHFQLTLRNGTALVDRYLYRLEWE